jgi:hypothetical protein
MNRFFLKSAVLLEPTLLSATTWENPQQSAGVTDSELKSSPLATKLLVLARKKSGDIKNAEAAELHLKYQRAPTVSVSPPRGRLC